MKVGYYNGFKNGYQEGRVQALQEFERILAVLREEIVDLRADAAGQSHRADAACDLLLGHLGARAISLAGAQAEVDRAERHVRSVQGLVNMSDPTEDLPIGHPLGQFATDREAAIALTEDIDGVMA